MADENRKLEEEEEEEEARKVQFENKIGLLMGMVD